MSVVDESGLSSTQVNGSQSEVVTYPADDEASSQADDCVLLSSQDTIIFPESCCSAPWSAPFQIPQFSHHVEIVLTEANKCIMPLQHTSEWQLN